MKHSEKEILGYEVSYISKDNQVFVYRTNTTDKEKSIKEGFKRITEKCMIFMTTNILR